MRIEPYKLAHWMNARKYTADKLAELSGVASERLRTLLTNDSDEESTEVVTALAVALEISPAQLASDAQRDLTVLCRTAEELQATCRPVQRDGIHFYNYYTMVAPPGRIAPVILDILCPATRLPALNNGHLEPAITVNLGPGDIRGRWAKKLTPDTWSVLAANDSDDRWITGDSYVEPSYCPHSYALATDRPARIVSYTGQSNLAALVEELNSWSRSAFAACVEALERGLTPGGVLKLLLARRSYTLRAAATAAGLSEDALVEALADPIAGLSVLRNLAAVIGFDYRLLLPADPRHDGVGKTCMTVKACRASARMLGSCRATSMASAPHVSDLTGLFLYVDARAPSEALELLDVAESHYLVIDGHPVLEWKDGAGECASRILGPNASAWVAPFVAHRWLGTGAVLKFGSGSHVGYLDLFELTNTYATAATIRRSRQDLTAWGYDQ
jgi:transcriptional regulator with XRE-family HTH domain